MAEEQCTDENNPETCVDVPPGPYIPDEDQETETLKSAEKTFETQ